jgi:GAF domain-containing protein
MKHKALTINNCIDDTTETRPSFVETANLRDLAADMLGLLNQTSNCLDLIKNILFLIKVLTGLEAAGLRLREGDDFPYYETLGFSKEFVEAERSLCSHDQTGAYTRDSQGNIYLECMCGNVICGRTDSSLPFFTEGGSFWTNSTTALLASTTSEDRQGRTRNRCNSEGYESVALIPLRYNKNNIGLLQLNDSRENMFTSQLISFFEGVGPSIAHAINHRQREDTQSQGNNKPVKTGQGRGS